MKLLLSTATGDSFSVEVAGDMKVEDLMALAQADSGIGGEVQLLHRGKALVPNQDLTAAGLSDDEIVMVLPKRPRAPPPTQQSPSTPAAASLPINIDFSAIKVPKPGESSSSRGRGAGVVGTRSGAAEEDPKHIHSLMANDPALLARMRERNPPLAEAFDSGDSERFAKVVKEQMEEKKAEAAKRLRMLTADPMDVEAQRLIMEEIEQANIEFNLGHAMEHTPESFGVVTMLYIHCKVNGFDIKAFVDSGAQSTIISAACAERTGLFRLMDRRFQGIAKGVGTQKILGRIHMAQLQIEDAFLPCSYTVLEDQTMDMLLGLDMLKRHQCCLDLKEGKLLIGTTGTETSFLPESELPAHARLNGVASPGPASPAQPASSNSESELPTHARLNGVASPGPASPAQPASSNSGQPQPSAKQRLMVGSLRIPARVGAAHPRPSQRSRQPRPRLPRTTASSNSGQPQPSAKQRLMVGSLRITDSCSSCSISCGTSVNKMKEMGFDEGTAETALKGHAGDFDAALAALLHK